jgi:hypothetical protein
MCIAVYSMNLNDGIVFYVNLFRFFKCETSVIPTHVETLVSVMITREWFSVAVSVDSRESIVLVGWSFLLFFACKDYPPLNELPKFIYTG